MKNIYIVRHCEAEGQSPPAPLTERGVVQAQELADFLEDVQVDYIVSSPFERALQTIQPFAGRRNMEVVEDMRLSERVLSSNPMSDWAEKLEATYQDLNLKFEGGESSNDAMKRIVSVVEDICESDSENAVIVAHGGILTLLLYFYTPHFSFDQWEGMSNPDVYLLKRSEGKNEVKRIWEEGMSF